MPSCGVVAQVRDASRPAGPPSPPVAIAACARLRLRRRRPWAALRIVDARESGPRFLRSPARRRLLAGGRPGDRFPGRPGGGPPAGDFAEQQQAEVDEPDQRELDQEQQGRDSERHPERAPESREQPGPHRRTGSCRRGRPPGRSGRRGRSRLRAPRQVASLSALVASSSATLVASQSPAASAPSSNSSPNSLAPFSLSLDLHSDRRFLGGQGRLRLAGGELVGRFVGGGAVEDRPRRRRRAAPRSPAPISCLRIWVLRERGGAEEEVERRQQQDEADRLQDRGEGDVGGCSSAARSSSASPLPLTLPTMIAAAISTATATKVTAAVGTNHFDSQATILRELPNLSNPSRGNRTGGAPLDHVRQHLSLSRTRVRYRRMSRASPHPCRPARGRSRPRKPPLPRLRRAAVRLARRAARPRGPVSRCESCGLGVVGGAADPEEALRELDRLGGEGGRGSPTAPASPARWAAPAGPAWSPAPATCSRSRRCAASSPAATRSSRRAAGRRWRASRRPGRRCSTASPSATTSPSAPSAAPGRCRPAKPWQRRIDALASIVLAIPALRAIAAAGWSCARAASLL